MGFIPQITCRHCGKKYSAIHSRCPHCGTRRVKQSSRTTSTTNSVRQGSAAGERAVVNTRWQFIFGCVLVAAVMIAVIVLIAVSAGGGGKAQASPSPSVTVTVAATPTPAPTPTPPPTPDVTSITINFLGESLTEFTTKIGATVDLDAVIYPVETEATPVWASDDESICTVDEKGVVTGVGAGWANVSASCGAITTVCRVLVVN